MVSFNSLCFLFLLVVAVSNGSQRHKKPRKVCTTITIDKRHDRVAIKDRNGDTAKVLELELIKRTTSFPCIKDKTYGFYDTYVYTKGCKGKFKVCYKEDFVDREECRTISLYSKRYQKDSKIVTNGTVKSMVLKKEHSGSKDCKRDRTYGFTKNAVFAKDGCKGEFKVCFQKY